MTCMAGTTHLQNIAAAPTAARGFGPEKGGDASGSTRPGHGRPAAADPRDRAAIADRPGAVVAAPGSPLPSRTTTAPALWHRGCLEGDGSPWPSLRIAGATFNDKSPQPVKAGGSKRPTMGRSGRLGRNGSRLWTAGGCGIVSRMRKGLLALFAVACIAPSVAEARVVHMRAPAPPPRSSTTIEREIAAYAPVARAAWPGSACAGREQIEVVAEIEARPDGIDAAGEAWESECHVRVEADLTGSGLCRILVHEFGHLAGLDHDPHPESVMHATTTASIVPACDKAAQRALTLRPEVVAAWWLVDGQRTGTAARCRARGDRVPVIVRCVFRDRWGKVSRDRIAVVRPHLGGVRVD